MSAPHHNAARGEVGLCVNGRTRRLCLTLGALAELEAAFGARDLGELADRLRRLSAGDLLVVLDRLMRGAGDAPQAGELEGSRIDLGVAAAAVAEAFRLGLEDAP